MGLFLTTIVSLLKAFFFIIKIPLIILACFVILFFVACVFQLSLFRFKGYKKPKGVYHPVKRKGKLRRLFWDFPRQIALDYFNRAPDEFRYSGVHLFCGEQGAGKTIALVEFMRRMQSEYPKAKCITNLEYEYQDDALDDWHQLIDYNNGKYGVIVGIDEMQNWFSSGKNELPPQMLEVVTQNRKNRRIILGTSQVRTRVNKAIREQVTLLYEPITFFNALTWVRISKPVLDETGAWKEFKRRGCYFFVHDKALRDMYDTYKCIESLSKEGFKPMPSDIVTNTTTVIKMQKAR